MKITVNGDTFDFDPKSITNREAMDLERVAGVTFGQWTDALKERSALAMTAMVWLVQRRERPGLKFGDVTFAFGELTVENEKDADEAEPSGVDPTSDEAGTTSNLDD